MTVSQKKMWIITTIIVCIGVVGVVLYATDSLDNLFPKTANTSNVEIRGLAEGTAQVPEISLKTTLPKISGQIMVYKANQEMTDQEIVKIAEDLGITGEPIKDSGMVFIEKKPFSISAEPSGGMVTYSNDTLIPGYSPEYISKYLPDDNKAQEIADSFLNLYNIRPEGAKFSHINHDIGYFNYKTVNVKNSESINVWYIHEIDGFRIFTDKMYVQVGVHGLVNRMFRKWTDPEPFREYPIITPEQAVEHLKKTGIVILGDVKDPQKATVTSVTLGYIGETQTKKLPYLLPVYQFEGVVQGADGTEAAFWQWIPATPELAAEIT